MPHEKKNPRVPICTLGSSHWLVAPPIGTLGRASKLELLPLVGFSSDRFRGAREDQPLTIRTTIIETTELGAKSTETDAKKVLSGKKKYFRANFSQSTRGGVRQKINFTDSGRSREYNSNDIPYYVKCFTKCSRYLRKTRLHSLAKNQST